MKNLSFTLVILLVVLTGLTAPAGAQAPVAATPDVSLLLLTGTGGDAACSPARATALPLLRRDQNPVVEVARSTLYGALAGTVLGLAAALVIEDSGETVKWGFVLGTFGGFIWGVTYASRQSSSNALIERDREGHVGLRIPSVGLQTGAPGERQVRMNLLRLSLDPR